MWRAAFAPLRLQGLRSAAAREDVTAVVHREPRDSRAGERHCTLRERLG